MPNINDIERDINSILDILEHATYGEEVRGAIIEAIQKCYTDVVNQAKQGKGISDIQYDDQTGNITFYIEDPSTGETQTKGPFLIKGDKGDTGEQGPRGDAGTPGETLVVDGSLDANSGNPIANSAVANALNLKLNASNYVVDATISSTSTNPVQNKAVYTELNKKVNKNAVASTIINNNMQLSSLKNAVTSDCIKTTDIDSTLSESSGNPISNSAVATALNSKIGTNQIDNELDNTSTNPVQNRAVANAINGILENYSAPDASLDVNSTHAIQNQAVARALNEKVNSADFNNTIFDDIDITFSNTNGGIYYNGDCPAAPALFIEGYGNTAPYTYYLSYVDSLYDSDDNPHWHRIANITDLVGRVIIIDNAISSTSENPVQNKVIAGALENVLDYEEITGSPTLSQVANYTDPTKTYHFYCSFNDINNIGNLRFISSNEVVEEGGITRYPESAQIITTLSGKKYIRVADDEGYFDDFEELHEEIQIDNALSSTSENPVQNKVIKDALDQIVAGGVIIDNAISSTSENPVQNKIINTALQAREAISNKDDAIDSTTSDTYDRNHYPSIKCLKAARNGLEKTAYKKQTISDQSQTGDSDTFYPTVGAVRDFVHEWIDDAVTAIEDEIEYYTNKVTSISANSTDTQYPSAKCVYDAIQSAINALRNELSQ